MVLTREKGYRKSPVKFQQSIKAYYRKYPKVARAMLHRHLIYNQTLDELEALALYLLDDPWFQPFRSRAADAAGFITVGVNGDLYRKIQRPDWD